MRVPPHLGRNLVIAAALLSAGFFGAYLRFLPYLDREATYTDGRTHMQLSEVERLRFAVWDDPVPLPPSVNTDGAEGRPALSPDGRLLVFAAGERGLNADLYVAELVAGEPGTPRPLSLLVTPSDELAPAFGNGALYFASDRPGGAGGLDLYRAPYRDGVFEPAVRLGSGVNTAADELDPAPIPGTHALAFASSRARGLRSDLDLYLARPRGADADGEGPAFLVQPLEALNSPFDDREPAFTGDGLGVVFASDRAGTAGGFDLWRSVQSLGLWQPPEPLPGLNSPASERGPAPSADGFTLWFALEAAGQAADLVRARSVELFRLPGRPVGWLDLTILVLLLALALLAWLGRRWEALDILYKCLLVSLVIHLLLMLWFREVGLEHEVVDPPADGPPAFSVRLAPSRAALAKTRERGGQVQAERAQAAPPSAPERLRETAAQARQAEPAAASLPAPSSARAEVPERAMAEFQPPARSAAAGAGTALAMSAAPAAVVVTRAPDATPLVAQATGATPSRRPSARPTRRARAAAPAASAGSAPAPAPRPLETPDLSDRSGPVVQQRDTTAEGQAAPGPARRGLPQIALRQAGQPASLPATSSGAKAASAESSSSGAADGLSLQPASTARARSASREPGRPGRWQAGPSATVATSGGTPTPAFRPLLLARSAPAALPAAPAERGWETTPYRTRFGDAKLRALREHGGTTQTEQAVAAGLRYLARIQKSGGFWGSSDDFHEKYGHVLVGKTALCLLAFLGAGHTPASGTEHSAVTERSVTLLLGAQDEDTGHFGYSSSYSHAVTTYALAECYALTREDRLRAPLQRALAWILRNQLRSRDERRNGGWGYYYPDGREFDRWPRASITVWQVMALESGRLGGLDVPDEAFDAARGFLRGAHRNDRGVILYSQDPARLRSAYWTLPGSTPAGLFGLSLLGEDITAPRYASAVDYVTQRLPDGFRRAGGDDFVSRATGNLYFWYYGSLAMFRHGGQPWRDWNQGLQATLLPSQRPDGSWLPISIYAEYAGDDRGDRSYTTAMCVLSLEIYYRYFTPLLQVR